MKTKAKCILLILILASLQEIYAGVQGRDTLSRDKKGKICNCEKYQRRADKQYAEMVGELQKELAKSEKKPAVKKRWVRSRGGAKKKNRPRRRSFLRDKISDCFSF